MPIDYRLVADLEEGLGDEHLSESRFGRSRFLRNAGLALFGLAAGVFAAPPQEAEAAPPGCYGYRTCRTCRGSDCVRCRKRFREALTRSTGSRVPTCIGTRRAGVGSARRSFTRSRRRWPVSSRERPLAP